MIKKTLFPVCLLIIFISSFANQTAYHPQGTWWINGGAGAAWQVSHKDNNAFYNGDGPALLGGLSFNYAVFDSQFIEFRATSTADIADIANDIFCISCGPYVNSVSDYALMYGLMKKEKYYMVGGSLGLAYTDIEYKEIEKGYDWAGNVITHQVTKTHGAVVGFPIEAQLFYTPFKYLGIGLVGMGNFNSEGSVMGVMLALQVGKLQS